MGRRQGNGEWTVWMCSVANTLRIWVEVWVFYYSSDVAAAADIAFPCGSWYSAAVYTRLFCLWRNMSSYFEFIKFCNWKTALWRNSTMLEELLLGGSFELNVGVVAWEAYTEKLSLNDDSVSGLRPSKITETLHLICRSQDLPDAYWLLASRIEFKPNGSQYIWRFFVFENVKMCFT
jgi:hypothetical protein